MHTIMTFILYEYIHMYSAVLEFKNNLWGLGPE